MPGEGFNATDYCRCARRLRHVHRRQPALLVHSLSRMSQAYDALTTEVRVRINPGAHRTQEGVYDFASRVADELEGGTLRYSARVRLLREARRHRIRRFDANLVIAAVQDKLRDNTREPTGRTAEGESHPSWAAGAVAFAVVQGLILVGAGYVFNS